MVSWNFLDVAARDIVGLLAEYKSHESVASIPYCEEIDWEFLPFRLRQWLPGVWLLAIGVKRVLLCSVCIRWFVLSFQ